MTRSVHVGAGVPDRVETGARGSGARLVHAAIPALAVVLCSVLAWRLIDWAVRGLVMIGGQPHAILADDVMISQRYAWNLAQGHGLVWNPGEYVQGFTNLGWTLLAALPYALGAPLGLGGLFLQIVTAILHGGLVAGIVLWACRVKRPLQGVIAGLVVAYSEAMLFWGMIGFETTAQAVLVTAACLPWLEPSRGRSWTPIWAALAMVVRPDACVVLVVVLTLAAVEARRRRQWVWAIGAAIAIVAAVFVFQRLYYGDWLPNTYALKATRGGSTVARGVVYLEGFAWSESRGVALLVAPVLALVWRWLSRQPTPLGYLAMVAVPYLWMAYVVKIGGDAFGNSRFFIAIIPLMAVFAGEAGHALAASVLTWRHWARAGVAAVVLVLLLTGLEMHHRTMAPPSHTGVAFRTPGDWLSSACIGIALAGMRPQVPTTVAVYYAGGTPLYAPGLRAHDMLGRSNRAIARGRAHPGHMTGHNKWDYGYSLGVVRPDAIVTGGPYEEPISPATAGFHPALWHDPLFQSEYREHRLWPAPGVRWPHQWVYVRASFKAERPFIMPEGCLRP